MRVGFAVAVLLNLLTSSDAHCSSTDSGSCHLQVMIATVSRKHPTPSILHPQIYTCIPNPLRAPQGVLAAPSARPAHPPARNIAQHLPPSFVSPVGHGELSFNSLNPATPVPPQANTNARGMTFHNQARAVAG